MKKSNPVIKAAAAAATIAVLLTACSMALKNNEETKRKQLNLSGAKLLPLFSADTLVLGIWQSEGVAEEDGIIRTEFVDVLYVKDSAMYLAAYVTHPYADSLQLLNTLPYVAYQTNNGPVFICSQTGTALTIGADSLLYNYSLDDSLLYEVSVKINNVNAPFAARKHYLQQCQRNDSLTLGRFLPSKIPYSYYRIYQSGASKQYYLQMFTPKEIQADFPLTAVTHPTGTRFNFVTQKQDSKEYLVYNTGTRTLVIYNAESNHPWDTCLTLNYDYRTTLFDSLFFRGQPVEKH